MVLIRTREQPDVSAPSTLADPWRDHPDAAIAERHRSRPIPPPTNLHLTAAEVDVSGAEGHDLADPKAMGEEPGQGSIAIGSDLQREQRS